MTADSRPHAIPAATVSRRVLTGRAAVLLLHVLRGGAAVVSHTTVGVLRGDLDTRRDRWLVDLVTRLGPAFIKAAQMLATRVDVLSPRVCAALGRLHDGVRPAALAVAADELWGTGLVLDRGADGVARPVATGSIASVYRATAPDGRRVAVKLLRPGVARQLTVDLELLRRCARLMARLPQMRGIPVVAVVDQMAQAVHSQLDLLREARFLEEFRDNMAQESGIRVPVVHRELSDEGLLVMEFIEGLRRRAPHEFPETAREQVVLATLRGIYRMLFIDGLVHCDLHPGNLYFLPDGEVVVVDAGFTVRLDERTRATFASFFLQMSVGGGEACAEILLSTATAGPDADTKGFRREIASLVRRNSGMSAANFNLVTFAGSLFDIQRRHGLYAAPEFVFPLLSLLVLEGTVRAFAPQVDFQKVAGPYLMKALFGDASKTAD
ncbi:ABC1 kinase family protein [Streptomyces sp. NPDC014991]|uniref:ABC1 kinase family protein n=1 Tax=Streptomyces sp. NPDC014991 TaxID=3364935 RepID=UPI0036FCA13B